jgi:hypothetical protein
MRLLVLLKCYLQVRCKDEAFDKIRELWGDEDEG